MEEILPLSFDSFDTTIIFDYSSRAGESNASKMKIQSINHENEDFTGFDLQLLSESNTNERRFVLGSCIDKKRAHPILVESYVYP